jgi:outer membrane lipopolysaccharide assembly protein LptE/RlpB
MSTLARLLVVAAIVMLADCGYRFPGQGTVLPGGGTKIYVQKFDNRTRDPGLENNVLDALQSEVLRRGQFALTPDASSADVVLEGTIVALETRPVAFSRSDEALQYETIMTVSAALRNQHTGKLVWRIAALRENDSYGAVPETVVAASSQFQQGSTLNQNDLSQLTDVQLSESQRQEALERVLDNISRDLYNSMVENF